MSTSRVEPTAFDLSATVQVDYSPIYGVAAMAKQRAITLKAVKAGAKPILQAAKAMAPRRKLGGGTLRRSLGVRAIKGRVGKTLAIAVIGPRKQVIEYKVVRPGGKSEKVWPAKYAHLVELGVRPHKLGAGSHLVRIVPAARLAKEDKKIARWSADAADPGTKPGRREYLTGLIKRWKDRRAEWETEKQRGTQHPGAAAKPFLRPAYLGSVARSAAITQQVMVAEVFRLIAKESRQKGRGG